MVVTYTGRYSSGHLAYPYNSVMSGLIILYCPLQCLQVSTLVSKSISHSVENSVK